MKKTTRSLIEELNSIAAKKDKEAILETRAAHIINGAINLLALLKENFSEEQAQELERRFINSIRTSDPNKFSRGIRKFRDLKEDKKSGE